MACAVPETPRALIRLAKERRKLRAPAEEDRRGKSGPRLGTKAPGDFVELVLDFGDTFDEKALLRCSTAEMREIRILLSVLNSMDPGKSMVAWEEKMQRDEKEKEKEEEEEEEEEIRRR
ncbi:hypothetical protein KM043_017253 [Ampulex compressa]|nr:hypothetical protein KM043_017253 [Ampulex compressa]